MTHVDQRTGSEEPVFHEVTVIEGSARRRNWSRDEKARIVAESLDPAVCVSAVARRHGVNPNHPFTWRRQLRDEAEAWRLASGNGVDGYVELATAPSSMTIEVVLDGVTVRVIAELCYHSPWPLASGTSMRRREFMMLLGGAATDLAAVELCLV